MTDLAPARLGPKNLPYRPCAGVVLINAEGLVFAGQRIDNPGDAYQMPQGGIDEGESPREAALRELTEETGVSPSLVTIEAETPDWIFYDLPDELQGRIWGGRFCGQAQKWFLMRFSGTDADIDIKSGHPEFSQWKWLAPAQVIDRIVPFKKQVYREIFQSFEPYL